MIRAAKTISLSGLLYISETHPWPSDEEEVLRRLPDEWLDERGLVRSNRRNDLPARISVRPDGELSTDDDESATTAWWTATPFRFCLACGVSYAGRLGPRLWSTDHAGFRGSFDGDHDHVACSDP